MKDYVQRVKKIHEEGFKTEKEVSYGWKYDWEIKES